MGTFNTYGNKSKKYGGAYPVWLTVKQKERCGGVLDPLPPVGTVIPAGTLVHLDDPGGKAEIISVFELAKDYTDNSLIVYFKAGRQFCIPRTGMKIMNVSNTNVDAVYPSITIESVKLLEVEELWEVSVSYMYVPEMKIGDMFMIGKPKANPDELEALIPTGLTENDVWIEEGDKYATVASVFHGEIMEDRIQPIPKIFKPYLPMIKFVKGI